MPRSIAKKLSARKPAARKSASRDVALRYRVAARASAVGFLVASMLYGAGQAGALDYAGSPFLRVTGKLASLIGMAADDIQITGIEHHDPSLVLSLIRVSAGGSLMQFDAGKAKAALESQNWISSASVQRKFPNQLEIVISERTPFAIWQMDGKHFVIDRNGVAMSGLDAMQLKDLPMVTGEGANLAAAEIVNQLVVNPELMSKLAAAARVGKRRWTLYLDNGVKIALPEQGIEHALQEVKLLDGTEKILSRGISELDLRVPGQVRIAVAEVKQAKAPQTPN
jgi:cell division protein FtsQ